MKRLRLNCDFLKLSPSFFTPDMATFWNESRPRDTLRPISRNVLMNMKRMRCGSVFPMVTSSSG